jgi:hypothetical protein
MTAKSGQWFMRRISHLREKSSRLLTPMHPLKLSESTNSKIALAETLMRRGRPYALPGRNQDDDAE